MSDKLNHAVFFVIMTTLAVTALQIIFAMIARMVGLDGLVKFFGR